MIRHLGGGKNRSNEQGRGCEERRHIANAKGAGTRGIGALLSTPWNFS